MSKQSQEDRYRGALLGLAAADALGTTLEFKPLATFDPIDDIVGGGPFNLKPGEWTDDTSMALCLAVSLVECNGFDPTDQMQRYVGWRDEGYMSSNGKCFDIGNTVAAALRRFEKTGEPYSSSTDPQTAGNGSIMRRAPVALFFASDPHEAISRAADSSCTTHGAREAVDACRYFAGLILGALHGHDKRELLAAEFEPVVGLWSEAPLAPKIAEIAAGSAHVMTPRRLLKKTRPATTVARAACFQAYTKAGGGQCAEYDAAVSMGLVAGARLEGDDSMLERKVPCFGSRCRFFSQLLGFRFVDRRARAAPTRA